MTGIGPTHASLPIGKRGKLALAVAAAVDTVKGVHRSGGSGVEVETQYPGGQVVGIHLGDQISVHIVAELLPLDAVIEAVRSAALSAVREAGDDRPVAVTVEDVDVEFLPPSIR